MHGFDFQPIFISSYDRLITSIITTFATNGWNDNYLAGIPVKKILRLEFKLAGVLTITTYVHCPMMITINFTNDKVMDASCNLKTTNRRYRDFRNLIRRKSKKVNLRIICKWSHLAPLKSLSIIKLQSQYSYWIKLYSLTPKSGLQVTICPEPPSSTFTMTSYECRVMAYLGYNNDGTIRKPTEQ